MDAAVKEVNDAQKALDDAFQHLYDVEGIASDIQRELNDAHPRDVERLEKKLITADNNEVVARAILMNCERRLENAKRRVERLKKLKTRKLKDCTPKQIRNPKTNRCVSRTSKIGKALFVKECPPDKILNPKSNRCVSRTSKLGKFLLSN